MKLGSWVAFTHSGYGNRDYQESTLTNWFVVAVGTHEDGGQKVLEVATENIKQYSTIADPADPGGPLVARRLQNLAVRQVTPLTLPQGFQRALLRRTWVCGECGGIGPELLTVRNHAVLLEHGKPAVLYQPDFPEKPEKPECSQPILLDSPVANGADADARR